MYIAGNIDFNEYKNSSKPQFRLLAISLLLGLRSLALLLQALVGKEISS